MVVIISAQKIRTTINERVHSMDLIFGKRKLKREHYSCKDGLDGVKNIQGKKTSDEGKDFNLRRMNGSKTSVDRTSSSLTRHTSSHHPSVDQGMMYRHHLVPLKPWTAIH